MSRPLWARIEPRCYEREVHPLALIKSFLMAFVLYLPSLQEVAQRYGRMVKTAYGSTLSYALRRTSSLEMVRALFACLDERFAPKPHQLVVIDSIPLTLPATRRHGCRRINRKTVGGAVLWQYCVQAAPGTNPIKICKIISGPWHDTQTIADVELMPDGPIYLMDRGFWCIEHIRRWLGQGVHFIVRANKQDFTFTMTKTLGPARILRNGTRIVHDGIARLGGAQRKRKPTVRLVFAYLADGTDLILISDLMEASAEAILEAYKHRWDIEEFHRFLKDTVGLAHLYSFQENGIMFLLHVAVLLAVLLFLSLTTARRSTVQEIFDLLDELRRLLGLGKRWKRNMYTTHPERKPKRKRRPHSVGKNH